MNRYFSGGSRNTNTHSKLDTRRIIIIATNSTYYLYFSILLGHLIFLHLKVTPSHPGKMTRNFVYIYKQSTPNFASPPCPHPLSLSLSLNRSKDSIIFCHCFSVSLIFADYQRKLRI